MGMSDHCAGVYRRYFCSLQSPQSFWSMLFTVQLRQQAFEASARLAECKHLAHFPNLVLAAAVAPVAAYKPQVHGWRNSKACNPLDKPNFLRRFERQHRTAVS